MTTRIKVLLMYLWGYFNKITSNTIKFLKFICKYIFKIYIFSEFIKNILNKWEEFLKTSQFKIILKHRVLKLLNLFAKILLFLPFFLSFSLFSPSFFLCSHYFPMYANFSEAQGGGNFPLLPLGTRLILILNITESFMRNIGCW